MKTVLFWVIVLLAGFLAAPILAADGPAASNATAEVKAATTAPTTEPADPAKVVATVGAAKITAGAVKRLLPEAEADYVEAMHLRGAEDLKPKDHEIVAKHALWGAIYIELGNQYVASKNVTCSDEELAAKKAEFEARAQKAGMTLADADTLMKIKFPGDALREIVKDQKIVEAATSPDKAAAYIKAHPDYFNGTTVKASHILIGCDAAASTADQKAAIAKLEKLSADIKAGKISFEQAAKDNSDDRGSKEKGGDLGEFTFARMVEPFSKAAFAMKVGDISGAVRSQFGFHIIKVTARTEGKEQADADASDVAKDLLKAELQDELLAMPLKGTPIVVNQ